MRDRDLDDWWASLEPKRKAQIHAWLAKESDQTELPNQIALFQERPKQEGEAL